MDLLKFKAKLSKIAPSLLTDSHSILDFPFSICVPSSISACYNMHTVEYFKSLGIGGFQSMFEDRSIWNTNYETNFQDLFDYSSFNSYKLNYRIIHGPFFNSFLSEKPFVVQQSIEHIAAMLSRLNIDSYVTHLGSAKNWDEKEAHDKLVERLISILEKTSAIRTATNSDWPQPLLLMENVVSNNHFGDLAFLTKVAESVSSVFPDKVGICLDTAHAFGYGYNLAHLEGLSGFCREYSKHIRAIHLNDAKTMVVKSCGSHKDKHDLLGGGLIGALANFDFLIKNLPNVQCIVLERHSQLLATIDALKLASFYKIPQELPFCVSEDEIYEKHEFTPEFIKDYL